MRSELGTPLSSQHTASPSMMQERERRPSNASTMSGNRSVRLLPGRLQSRTWSPSLRATRRKPSCLISCSQTGAEGGLSAFVGKHGAMKPVGKTRCNMPMS